MANNDEVFGMIRAIMAEEGGCPLSIFCAAKMFSSEPRLATSALCMLTLCWRALQTEAGGVGYKIHKVGADLSQLKQACCEEMHPMGKPKNLEVMNQNLVGKSLASQ